MKPTVFQLFTGTVKRAGNPNATNPMDRPWESGIFKTGTDERIWLGRTGLTGDEVADTINHGGPEKALFAYPVKHYEEWKKELGSPDLQIGFMGENLALLHMDEDSVCIGDTYRLGTAVIQVSQPRRPCWKPARRLRRLDFALKIQDSGRTGWYFRVLQEGYVQAGMEIELIERPFPEWTVAACNQVMYVSKNDLRLSELLASCELLAENWRRSLAKRLLGKPSSNEDRVYGPNTD